MKISTKGRYALRLMVDLAVHTEDGGFAPLRAIAQRQSLSDKYLEQLIAQLARAGFVQSARGAQAATGCRATPPPTRSATFCG